jgi:hypothetical protein
VLTGALPRKLRSPWLRLSTWPAAALASKSVLIGAPPFHEIETRATPVPSPRAWPVCAFLPFRRAGGAPSSPADVMALRPRDADLSVGSFGTVFGAVV